MAKFTRTGSLPAIEPRRKLPPLRSRERGADFWEGVEGFAKREEALRKDWAVSSTNSLNNHSALSNADMHMLADMGYRGPMYLSLMNRSKKELLLQKQASGNLKQFRAAVRAAELHVGFNDPLVIRMRGCLKDADMGIRALKQDGENTQTLTDVMNRIRNLDVGRQVWDDPVLAAARDKYMSWRASSLHSPNAGTRKASCAALAALGSASSPLQAASLARVQHPASKYASDLGALFSDSSYDVRHAAINACIRMGEAGTKAVLTQLDNPEPLARITACEALSNVENGSAHADLLTIRLRDVDAEVRCSACMAFETFAKVGARYADAVAGCLHDSNSRVRRSSCYALGSMGEVAADFISDFGMLLEDDNEEVRVAASEALRRLGAEGLATLRAVEARLAAAAISNRKELSSTEDRLEAIEALSAMREDSDTEDAALEYLHDVAACFTDESVEVRKAAILAFQNFSTATYASALADDVAKNLDDEDDAIRIAAVNSLMTMDHGSNEEHLNAVLGLLDDANKDVRKAVVDAMGNSAEANPSTTRHIMKLAELTKDDSKEMQEAAVNALANMGQGGKAITNAMRMDHEDENVRLAAIEALSELNLFNLSEAELQRRKEESIAFLQVPLIGSFEGDDDDDVFGPITQRSYAPSMPVSARSQKELASPFVARTPVSARSIASSRGEEPKPLLSLRPSPLMVQPEVPSNQQASNNEEEPASPLSPSTSRKFTAARTWRRGALLARAVSGFKKAQPTDSSSDAQQDDQQLRPLAAFKKKLDPVHSIAVGDSSEQETSPKTTSPKTPGLSSKKAKPPRSIRFQEEPIVTELLPVTESADVLQSEEQPESPKSPFSPKKLWRRGIKGVIQRQREEQENMEREARAIAEEAGETIKVNTRKRKQGELGKFLKGYGRGDPFAKELLEAKEAKKRKEKTEFSALDLYLGAPERVAEYNSILHIAFVGLLSRLRDPSERQRIAACNAFCTFNANAEDVAPVVGPLLYDESQEVHHAARACLVCIGGTGIDRVNRYDREKRAKRKQGICRFIVESWIKASPPYIEQWAPRDTAFKVNDARGEAAKHQTAVFFQTSTEGKVTQLDTTNMNQYLLRSDNPDFQLSAEEKESLKRQTFKYHRR